MSSFTLRRAAIGSSPAMMRLFSKHGGMTLFLCGHMLLNDAEAERTCLKIYSGIWDMLRSNPETAKRPFTETLRNSTARACKKAILERAENTFRDESAANALPLPDSPADARALALSLLDALPDRQRFLVLIRSVFDADAESAAKALKIDAAAAGEDLGKAENSVKSALEAACARFPALAPRLTYEDFGAEIKAAALSRRIPKEMKPKARNATAPFSTDKQRMRRLVKVLAILVAIELLIFGGIFLYAYLKFGLTPFGGS